MIDVQQALKQLRDKIAQIIANLETWATLDAVCLALSLPQEDSTGLRVVVVDLPERAAWCWSIIVRQGEWKPWRDDATAMPPVS